MRQNEMGWQLRDPIGSWLQSDRTRPLYQLYSEGEQLFLLHFWNKVSRPSVTKSPLIKFFIFTPPREYFLFYIPLEILLIYGDCLTFFCHAPQQAAVRSPWSLLFSRLNKPSSPPSLCSGQVLQPSSTLVALYHTWSSLSMHFLH